VSGILVVHPGASYSVADVYTGMVPELQKLGVEIHEYDLGSRLDISGRFLHMIYRLQKRADPTLNKYTPADVIYKASIEILERALRFDVDGVLVFSGMFVAGDAFVLLKRAHVRTAVLLSESPYDVEKEARILPWVDVAWTNERSSVAQLRKSNPNVNYMPHAYNPEVHRPEDPDEAATVDVPAHDVVFVGSLFAERVDLLAQVDWTGIDLGLYGEWSGLPSRHKLRKYLAGGIVDNRYSAALYRKAKIGLNLYRESIGWGRNAPRITHAESMNPRTLELAACGCFQLSQWRSEISETFGIWVPTFEDVTEMERLIRYYLEFDGQRELHARKAMDAVQGHTFAARAQTIVDDLARAEWPVKQLVTA
jgi:spore maturation protein CgeB